jgi:50S ribosomal protein L16 3-hydroxylase
MDLNAPLVLLGGLSPAAFMRRHWQKRPLRVRQAWPGAAPPLARPALFDLAGRDGVESRLVERVAGAPAGGWRLRHGPLARRTLPPLSRAGWTLLVQGLDLHVPAARAMLDRFAFVPHARLDDLMVSWASDAGGVGPHVDSYDVFLIQLEGRRRWRVGRVRDDSLAPGLPLKILQRFEPEHDWLLEPGDMLYLPPRWGHDGVAEGACMTASVGFRAPARDELARELLLRLAEDLPDDPRLYADPSQAATATPGRLPAAMADFAADALRRVLARLQAGAGGHALGSAVGEWLTEPKPNTWFEPADAPVPAGLALRLDPRTRMLYDDRHVFINGESWRTAGSDARVLRGLADTRRLPAAARRRLGSEAAAVIDEWCEAGWLRQDDEEVER